MNWTKSALALATLREEQPTLSTTVEALCEDLDIPIEDIIAYIERREDSRDVRTHRASS